jgi:hypothetical protein
VLSSSHGCLCCIWICLWRWFCSAEANIFNHVLATRDYQYQNINDRILFLLSLYVLYFWQRAVVIVDVVVVAVTVWRLVLHLLLLLLLLRCFCFCFCFFFCCSCTESSLSYCKSFSLPSIIRTIVLTVDIVSVLFWLCLVLLYLLWRCRLLVAIRMFASSVSILVSSSSRRLQPSSSSSTLTSRSLLDANDDRLE